MAKQTYTMVTRSLACRLLSVLAASLLAGCSGSISTADISTGSILPSLSSLPSPTAFVPSFGGSEKPVRPERVSGNLYRLPPSTRPATDRLERENYDMLRAAEFTRELGGSHFVLVTLNGPSSGAPLSGAGAAVGPGTLVRILSVPLGAESPVGAVAAEEILHFLGPQFGREPPRGLPANPAFPMEPAAPPQAAPRLRGT